MIRMLICGVLLGMLALAACNKQTSSSDSAPAANANPAGTSQPMADASALETAPAETAEAAVPASITLTDGKSVNVIAASVVDGDPKAHAGLVAIAGEVTTVFADKGTFMLKDCPKDADCKTEDSCSCCSKAEVPVRLVMEQYEGSLPEAKQDVIVIAELSPTETGYTLAVREVRSGEKTLLTRKA